MSAPDTLSSAALSETSPEIPERAPVRWWLKLLVLVLVALLCIAFAGMIWALIL